MRVFVAVFVERVHAQTFLPPGFTAGPANEFFNRREVESDRGVLVFSVMQCETSTWQPDGFEEGMVGVFVRPPSVDGERVDGEHFYELARASTGPPGTMLDGLGWARLGDDVEVSHETMPAYAGSGSVRDEEGDVFRVATSVAPAADDFTGELHLSWWHQNERGLGRFTYAFSPNGYLGPGDCEARVGSAAARVMETDTCPNALFMVGPPFDVVGGFRFDPGLAVDA